MNHSQISKQTDAGKADHPVVGVIGVGLLGGAIAERLVAAGFQVMGFDPQGFSIENVTPCDSVGSLVDSADTIFLSLPDSRVAAEVMVEARDHLHSGHVIVDTTTGIPDDMASMARQLEALGVVYLETNVAGSSDLMRRKEAILFLGGDHSVIESQATLWKAISRKRFHLGPVGAASRFKLVHNMILGLHRLVLAEGMEFAKAQGIDPHQLLEILVETPAASAVMKTKGPRMATGNYEPPQARLSQHLKDVRLMIAEAEKHGAVVPLTLLHQLLLEQAEQLGLGSSDNSAVVEYFKPSTNQPD